MRLAIVHELLTMRGGAERVLRILADAYPDAPIFTLLYDERRLGKWFPPDRVRTSTLQKYVRYSANHHLYLPFFPGAVEAWDFSNYDVVLSTSSAFAHGIITNGAPKHLCYVHSPARYLWDRTHDVLDKAEKGILGPMRKAYLSRTFHKLRIWDAEAAARPDALIAASRVVQRRIELYWRRDSEVIYPPIDDYWLNGKKSGGCSRENPAYFLVVSTLVPYKRIELAIQACEALHIPLKIVGEGPDRKRLKGFAGHYTEFYGRRQDDELRDLYADAQAVIFPGEEDFGLVPLEAMSQGTPVIAFRAGGALETIIEGVTGVFFDEPTSASLAECIKSFNPSSFSSEECRKRAHQFSSAVFLQQINSALQTLHAS